MTTATLPAPTAEPAPAPADWAAMLAAAQINLPRGIRTHAPSGIIPWPFVLIEGEEKAGKAQPLHSKIATPSGWTTMGALAVGDEVLGANGRPTRVTAVYDRGMRPIYRLTFTDGAAVEACDEHLWSTTTSTSLHRYYNKGPKKGLRNVRPPVLRTTAELRQMVLDGVVVHVPMAAPVHYQPGGPLPLDPYALGLLLGDGGLSKPSYPTFTSGDPELFEALQAALPAGDTFTYSTTGDRCASVGIKGGRTATVLKDLGLLPSGSASKFIPEAYLRATPAERLALLQGLLDTDGGMQRASVSYTTVSPRLADQVQELVRSLGGTCSVRTKQPFYRDAAGARVTCKTAYRLGIRLTRDQAPSRLARKAAQRDARRAIFHTPPRRTVRSVDYVDQMPARCIAVDAEDHLYLTDGFVVTHNTWEVLRASGDPRIGMTFFLEIGEPCAEEYGRIPGARYEVVEHNGTHREIADAVREIAAFARNVNDAKLPPVMLVVDSGSSFWDLQKDWTTRRARNANKAKEILRRDPDAEIEVASNRWNDAARRWYEVVKVLMTFPGIAVMVCRGKEVVRFENGQPVAGQTDWSVEAQKHLGFNASMWIRMFRQAPPVIVGARSTIPGVAVKPGTKDLRVLKNGLDLPHLVFDILQCSAEESRPRVLVDIDPEDGRPVVADPAAPAHGSGRAPRSASPTRTPPEPARPAPLVEPMNPHRMATLALKLVEAKTEADLGKVWDAVADRSGEFNDEQLRQAGDWYRAARVRLGLDVDTDATAEVPPVAEPAA